MLSSQTLKIFNSLQKSTNILDLDMSWNTMPTHNLFTFRPISIFLATNINLMHLNLSYMNLASDFGVLLMKSISKSESLLSVHLSGNKDLVSAMDNFRQILEIKTERKQTGHINHSNNFMPKRMDERSLHMFSFDKINMSFFDKLQKRDISKYKYGILYETSKSLNNKINIGYDKYTFKY
jgi:hypothetical protein